MRHSQLTMYGIPYGFTAMARSTGWPLAIAAKLVLNGKDFNDNMMMWLDTKFLNCSY